MAMNIVFPDIQPGFLERHPIGLSPLKVSSLVCGMIFLFMVTRTIYLCSLQIGPHQERAHLMEMISMHARPFPVIEQTLHIGWLPALTVI